MGPLSCMHQEAAATVASGAPRAEGVDEDLHACTGCWLAGSAALLAVQSGALLLVQLLHEAGAVRSIKVRDATMADLIAGYWLIGM